MSSRGRESPILVTLCDKGVKTDYELAKLRLKINFSLLDGTFLSFHDLEAASPNPHLLTQQDVLTPFRRDAADYPVENFDFALAIKSAHQSGVNSLSARTSTTENTVLLLSSGDDSALFVAELKVPLLMVASVTYDVLDATNNYSVDGTISVLSATRRLTRHCSSLTTCWTDGRVLFATGPDQVLSMWLIKTTPAALEWIEDTVHNIAHCSSSDAIAESGYAF